MQKAGCLLGHDELIQGLADFRIRARMIQLGHIEAKGALNYVSRERIQPFAFNPDAWKENELSYVVDPWTVERLQKENKDFQAFMDRYMPDWRERRKQLK